MRDFRKRASSAGFSLRGLVLASANPHRLNRLRKKYFLLSSRAKRGICFFANPTKKADSSGKIRPRNDKIGVFPQPLKPAPLTHHSFWVTTTISNRIEPALKLW